MITNLQNLRNAAGLTQLELAQKTGLNLRTLQYYEQGVRNLDRAKFETLLKLCLALNCKLPDLLSGSEYTSTINAYFNLPKEVSAT